MSGPPPQGPPPQGGFSAPPGANPYARQAQQQRLGSYRFPAAPPAFGGPPQQPPQ